MAGVVFEDGLAMWTDTAYRDTAKQMQVICHDAKAFRGTTFTFPFAGKVAGVGVHTPGIVSLFNQRAQWILSEAELVETTMATMREHTQQPGRNASVLLGFWAATHALHQLGRLPDVLPAFQPLERTSWFQPAPNCPEYHEGCRDGSTPELARASITAAIGTAYDNYYDGQVRPWVAGSIVEIVISVEGVRSGVIIEGVPDVLAA